MKKLALIMTIIMLSASLGGCGMYHTHRMMKTVEMANEGFGTLMEKKLDLSEEQVEQLDAITEGKLYDSHRRMMTMFGEIMDLDPQTENYDALLQQTAEQNADMVRADILDFGTTRAQIYEILDDDQITRLQEIRAEMAERSARRHERYKKRMKEK